jgi:sec-independent protein translocase protein TatA
MFGIGFSELLVIMVIVLILFGPDKLPEAAQSFGRFMAILKRNSDALRREFYNSVYTPAEDLKSRMDMSAREIIGFDLNDPASLNCEQKAKKEEEDRKKAESPPVQEKLDTEKKENESS